MFLRKPQDCNVSRIFEFCIVPFHGSASADWVHVLARLDQTASQGTGQMLEKKVAAFHVAVEQLEQPFSIDPQDHHRRFTDGTAAIGVAIDEAAPAEHFADPVTGINTLAGFIHGDLHFPLGKDVKISGGITVTKKHIVGIEHLKLHFKPRL